MKRYYHPVSMTSRPIVAFAADHPLPLELQGMDPMTGEHLGAGVLTFGAVIRLDYAGHPNVQRCPGSMKRQPARVGTNEAFHAYFAAPHQHTAFVGL